MLRKLLYFGSNKKSIPFLSPTGYRPTRIYALQKRRFSGYKPWACIRDFTGIHFTVLFGNQSYIAKKKIKLNWTITWLYEVLPNTRRI